MLAPQAPLSRPMSREKTNTMNIKLTSVSNGVYPSRMVLESAFDTRVIEVEITAQSAGQVRSSRSGMRRCTLITWSR